MTEQGQGKQTRCPRWFRVVLGVSLALNLAVVGLAVGAALRFGGEGGMHPPPRNMATAMIREMPKEERRALWNKTRGTEEDRRADRRAETEAVTAALREVPFDAGALEAVLSEQDARRAAFQASVRQAWLERVSQMSDEDRAAYADRVDRAMSRAHASHRRKD